MTSSIRSRLSGNPPSRSRRAADPEERFTRNVTIGFIALIVAVVIIVIVAFIYDYWVGHLKPVASVGGQAITRDQWVDRARLALFRLDTQEQDIREQISAGTLDPDEASTRLSSIESQKQYVASTAIEDLIDLTYQGQLAAGRGLTVTDADVDAAIADEATSPEARRISVIVLAPDAPNPSPEDVQALHTKAREAAAALASGTAFEEVARQFSTDASKDKGGEFGFVTRESSLDPAFLGSIFALAEGETTGVIKGADGVWRIGRVDAITPGTFDTGLEREVRARIGWDQYRSQVRKEALAQKLEDGVVADATEGDLEQAHVAEILLEGDTSVPADEDEGTIHARHILYSPNDDPGAAQNLPEDDPAWEAARLDAQKAVDQLRAVTDPELRQAAFAMRAKAQSDDTGSGARGGDLGFFARDQMVAEFADPLFDATDLASGDILDAVRSQYGWHVIEFQERTPGLGARLDEVVAQLGADGADFAAVARELSGGAEAPDGGDLGWLARAQLAEEAADAILALEPGTHSEAIPQDDGYHIYQLLEKADRPLDAAQRAIIAETAFSDWYEAQKEQAEADKVITRDDDLFSNTPSVGG